MERILATHKNEQDEQKELVIKKKELLVIVSLVRCNKQHRDLYNIY